MAILGILDNASRKINSINNVILFFKASELKGIYFFHDIHSELDKFLIGKQRLMTEETIGHLLDSLDEVVLGRSELPRLDVDRLSNELVVIFANMFKHYYIS